MDKPTSKQRPWSSKKTAARPMQTRERSSDFYHTARWTRESRLFREENPLCSKCEEEGIIYPSEVTDHKIPLEICEDPWDKKNWDAICRRHNNIKAAQDKILIKQYRKNNPNEKPDKRHQN